MDTRVWPGRLCTSGKSGLSHHWKYRDSQQHYGERRRLVLIRVGSRFRRFRKAAHVQLQPKVVEAYRDIQSEDAKQLVWDILKAPQKHQEHVKRFSNSVILRMTYGKSTPTANTDPEVVGMKLVVERFGIVMQPGAFLVDRIPILRADGAGQKRDSKWYRWAVFHAYTSRAAWTSAIEN